MFWGRTSATVTHRTRVADYKKTRAANLHIINSGLVVSLARNICSSYSVTTLYLRYSFLHLGEDCVEELFRVLIHKPLMERTLSWERSISFGLQECRQLNVISLFGNLEFL